MTRPRFALGRLVATSNALTQVSHADIFNALQRHLAGNWGLVDDEDRNANNLALTQGTRLVSAYDAANGTRFWIITEWDRSATTVLLPEDY